MDLRQLEALVKAAETGSVSRAAALLDIAQPALSRQIAALEAELGQTLLLRHGRGVTPTEAGELLLRHARAILSGAERAREDLQALFGAPAGRVAIGMPTSAALVLAVPLYARLRAKRPDIRLSLLEAYGGHLRAWLTDGVLDAAVMYNPERSRGLVAETVLEEDLYVIGPAGDPVLAEGEMTLEQLARLKLILPGPGHNLRRTMVRAARRRRLALDVAVEVDSLVVTRQLVERGYGYTVLARGPIQGEIDAGRLAAARLVRPAVRRQVALVTAQGRPLGHVARDALHLARLEMRRLVAEGIWRGRVRPAVDAAAGLSEP